MPADETDVQHRELLSSLVEALGPAKLRMPTDDTRKDHLHSVLANLGSRLQQLLDCQPRRRNEFSPVPKVPAIYLLSEDGIPAYAGRTRNLRKRLGEHMRPSSGRYQATFAFRLAKRKWWLTSNSLTDAELEEHPSFRKDFRKAKDRVSRMAYQYVEISDPIEQALLEVYVAESLATEHNSFRTH